MSRKDAKTFLEKLEIDSTLQSKIVKARNESEVLQIIRNDEHLQFDQKEFQTAFEEKFHRSLKKEELHKMATLQWISPEVAAKLPFITSHPHHGE